MESPTNRQIRSTRSPGRQGGSSRRRFVVAASGAMMLTLLTVAAPAVAEPPVVVGEADTGTATTVEAAMSLLVDVDGTFHLYVNQFNFGFDMSGDGQWVVFVDDTGRGQQLFRLHVPTGRVEPVAPDHHGILPAISDDGRFVAFVTSLDHAGGQQIWRWDAATGTAVRLSGPTSADFVAISDDGRVVAWTEFIDANADSIDGPFWRLVVWSNGRTRARTVFAGPPVLSDDGRFVVYQHSDTEVAQWEWAIGGMSFTPFEQPFALPVVLPRSVSDDAMRFARSGPFRNDYHSGSAVTVAEFGGGDLAHVRHPLMYSSLSLPPAFLSGDASRLLLSADQNWVESELASESDWMEDLPGTSHYLVDVDSGAVTRGVTPFFALPVVFSDDGTKALMYETVDLDSYRLWLADFDPGRPPVVTVEQLQHPQLTDSLRRLYRVVLGRSPSASELVYWSRQRAGGARLADIAQQFINSSEFVRTHGELNDHQFVARLSRNVDHRVDGDWWTRRLIEGAGRGEVAAGMSAEIDVVDRTDTSWPSPPEAAQVWRLYRSYFLRDAEQAGLTYWLEQYWTGTPLATISDLMAASAEFDRRYGTLTDGQFVDRVYANVLGRRPDVAGRSYWIARLTQGMTRGELMLAFSDSPEFIRLTDTLPPR